MENSRSNILKILKRPLVHFEINIETRFLSTISLKCGSNVNFVYKKNKQDTFYTGT